MTGRLDVVVVAYGSAGAIAARVEDARRLPGVGRVVVVDHGSDGSGDLARAAGAVVIADPSNPGFGSGHNRGVAATDAPYVLLLNPDAVPDEEGVCEGLAVLDSRADVAAVQGVIVGATTGAPERSQGVAVGPLHLLGRALHARGLLRFPWVRRLARRLGPLADHVDRVPCGPREVEALAATVLLVRRAAFEEVGGFDETFFLYGEDLDLCRRLGQAGWKLVALPGRWATHASGGSAESGWRRELEWWRGTMRFAAYWWGRAAWAVSLLAACIPWIELSVARPRGSGEAARALLLEPLAARRRRHRAPRVR